MKEDEEEREANGLKTLKYPPLDVTMMPLCWYSRDNNNNNHFKIPFSPQLGSSGLRVSATQMGRKVKFIWIFVLTVGTQQAY